jgi:hypothetical protein
MTKRVALLASLLAFHAPLPAQSTASRATIQQSLGFEDQTTRALTGWHSSVPGSATADNNIAHSGHWSVRLQRDAQSTGAFSALSQTLPVNFQGHTVELTGYFKLQDVVGNAGLWIRQDGEDGTLSIENMQSQQVGGTRDWAKYRITLSLQPQTQELVFGVLLIGTGTLWSDDLELLVDGKPIADAPAAPPAPELPGAHEFDGGSNVVLSALTPTQIFNLATLARVWGMLKYHHPTVTSGQRQWDFELFRILPAILAAPDHAHANRALLAWIDKLGPVPTCSPCVPAPAGDLDLKPALAWMHDRGLLGAPLSQRLEAIYANRTGKQFYVSLVPGMGNPKFEHEPGYTKVSLPDAGYQLLALFRWWNILQYWAPDRDVAGQDWSAVLSSFIPKLALAKDKTSYQLVLFELIAKANDTHANLWNSFDIRPPVGNCAMSPTFRFLDNKPVVYRLDATDTLFHPGDILDTLDGVAVQTLLDQWTPFYAASNQAARQRDFASHLTLGPCGPVAVTVMRGGHSLHLSATRIPAKQSFGTHDQPGDTFRLLSLQVAYVKLSSIKTADLPSYFEQAKDTKGLIVDIRNYPSAFMPFAMGSYLATSPTPFVAFTFPDLANPGAFAFGEGPRIQPGPVHYGGKVVILVDESSLSQAEYTALALRAMPNAVVVGSTTSGADGDVSPFSLPGRTTTMISGLGVFYPDHRPTQRVGIVPDVTAKPTLQGLAAGRDEVLETAVDLIDHPK